MFKPAALIYDKNTKSYIFGQFQILFDSDEGEQYCTVVIGNANDPQNEIFDGSFKECIDYCLEKGAVDYEIDEDDIEEEKEAKKYKEVKNVKKSENGSGNSWFRNRFMKVI